jgi:ubiquinone biosynthesis protein COQ9
MALPSNLSTSVHELASLSDEIWFLSGDTSVDTSWYTKRASLSTIYAATDLYMTTDKSEGFQDTKEFLDRRFEDSFKMGTTVKGLGEWLGFTAGASINVLRSKGVRI